MQQTLGILTPIFITAVALLMTPACAGDPLSGTCWTIHSIDDTQIPEEWEDNGIAITPDGRLAGPYARSWIHSHAASLKTTTTEHKAYAPYSEYRPSPDSVTLTVTSCSTTIQKGANHSSTASLRRDIIITLPIRADVTQKDELVGEIQVIISMNVEFTGPDGAPMRHSSVEKDPVYLKQLLQKKITPATNADDKPLRIVLRRADCGSVEPLEE